MRIINYNSVDSLASHLIRVIDHADYIAEAHLVRGHRIYNIGVYGTRLLENSSADAYVDSSRRERMRVRIHLCTCVCVCVCTARKISKDNVSHQPSVRYFQQPLLFHRPRRPRQP